VVNPNGAGGSETATKVEYDLTFTKTGTKLSAYLKGDQLERRQDRREFRRDVKDAKD